MFLQDFWLSQTKPFIFLWSKHQNFTGVQSSKLPQIFTQIKKKKKSMNCICVDLCPGGPCETKKFHLPDFITWLLFTSAEENCSIWAFRGLACQKFYSFLEILGLIFSHRGDKINGQSASDLVKGVWLIQSITLFALHLRVV